MYIMSVRISDEKLIQLFKASPLSRRSIRNRLNKPPNSVISAVLYSACKRKILYKVKPQSVGSLKKSIHVYDIYRSDKVKKEETKDTKWLFG